MGANNCTHIAIITAGRNFPICRRIEFALRLSVCLNPALSEVELDFAIHMRRAALSISQHRHNAKNPYSGKGAHDIMLCAMPQIEAIIAEKGDNAKSFGYTNRSGRWVYSRRLVVQVSGGALARTSSVAPSIKIKSNFRGNRVDTIFRAGLIALLFFFASH